jgi:CAAX protease family protein
MSSDDDHSPVLLYLLFTFLLSSVFYFLIIKSGNAGGGGGYVTGLMWCPAVAALLTCNYLGRDVGSLGWKWGKSRYHVLRYLLPLGYGAVTYAGIWLTGLGGLYDKPFVAAVTERLGLGPLPTWAGLALYFLFAATTGVIRGCSAALGEEIGWRGFLVPELAKRTSVFTATAVISGCIWALWHSPIIIFADYNQGTPVWYGVTCMTVGVIALSFVMAWIRLKSGSLWTGVVLHASHNLFIQQFFDPITIDTGRTKYIAGEFGVGMLVPLILLAAYFWTRRGEVSGADNSVAAEGRAVVGG